MRIVLLFLVLFISKLSFSQGQPWVGNNAVWLFHLEYPCLDCYGEIYRVRKTGNVVRGSHLCDELVTYRHGNTINPLDSVVIDTNYTYLSVTGDSVMYEQNGVFRILYDFSKQVGDSSLVHVTSLEPPLSNCFDSSYATVFSNDIVTIGTEDFRVQEISVGSTHQIQHNAYTLVGTFNERFGSMDYCFLFPIKNNHCGGEIYYFTFLCFTDDDLTYDAFCDYIGIEKNDLPTIEVMPNPFSQFIYISELNDSQKTITVWLSDNLGTTLFKGTAKELEDFNAENLRAGSYWLRINLENGHSVTKQLVKL